MTTRSCPSDAQPAPGATNPATPGVSTPGAEAFTTQDGIRFVVDTVVSALVVPWSLAFAPDGRAFLTERAGRVRILNLATGASELALTLDDVFAQSEAGL